MNESIKRLKEYVENDMIYKNYKEGELINPSDFDNFCVQHCIDIELLIATLGLYKGSLKKEHEAIHRANDLEDENKQLNLQLEEEMYNLKDIIICAFRYALGRHTYITYFICDYIKNHKFIIDKRVKDILLRDLEQLDMYYSDKGIDYVTFIDFKEWLENLEVK